jgi:hypothetical protein
LAELAHPQLGAGPHGRLAEQRLERVEIEGQPDPCARAVPQHALHERLREPAVGHIVGPIEQPFGGRADEDVGQLPLGLEVARRREPAELAVPDSPPIGRCEASDSHGAIVTCLGSDDRES